jgi:hypothetical protein
MHASSSDHTKWTLLAQPERPGTGQRFFAHVDRPHAIFIADNSGATPDTTEDGPLLLNAGCPVVVGIDRKGAISAYVEVWMDRDDNAASRVGLSAKEAAWLVSQGVISVRADVDARNDLCAAAILFRAMPVDVTK